MLACAMALVALASLLPTVEDWFGGRRELREIEPLLAELQDRQPDLGIGVRPRGPLAFQVAEKLSMISDALFLEASSVAGPRLAAPPRRSRDAAPDITELLPDIARPQVTAGDQAHAIASWIIAGRGGNTDAGARAFPGLGWLHQPEHYSDRDWIIEIARQYRALA
jgi:hypothetical protein